MAKQSGNSTGQYRGRVGNTIGYMWRGQWCVRQAPKNINDARSDAQVQQRGLFVEQVRFAGRISTILRTSMRTRAIETHMTECNYFVKLNKQMFSMEEGVIEVDYAGLKLSEGPVAAVGFGVPVLDGSRVVTVPFEKNPDHRRASTEDDVYLAAICPDLKQGILSGSEKRRSKQVSIVLPESWTGHEVQLYGFVQDQAGRSSESSYIGCGIAGEVVEPDEVETATPAEEIADTPKAGTAKTPKAKSHSSAAVKSTSRDSGKKKPK